MIKPILICLLLCALSLGSIPAAPDYRDYRELLGKYVSEDGVRYEAWAASPEDLEKLDRVLEQMAAVEVGSLSRAGQKAFYINLYNAAMLQAVFDHWPLESVKEIGLLPFSIFREDFIVQGERKLSLDAVEKEILLKEYFDPRIHFAVNCASESCPPLRAEPFKGSELERQLEEQTRAFARSDRAARIRHGKERVAFSELFKWYADDFPEGPVDYLNRYREEAIPADYERDWIDYDWALNTAAE